MLEELGVAVTVGEGDFIGRAEAPAANEPGRRVVADLFRVVIDGPVTPAAAIEEIAWVNPDEAQRLHVAPLTRDHVITLSQTRGRPT